MSRKCSTARCRASSARWATNTSRACWRRWRPLRRASSARPRTRARAASPRGHAAAIARTAAPAVPIGSRVPADRGARNARPATAGRSSSRARCTWPAKSARSCRDMFGNAACASTSFLIGRPGDLRCARDGCPVGARRRASAQGQSSPLGGCSKSFSLNYTGAAEGDSKTRQHRGRRAARMRRHLDLRRPDHLGRADRPREGRPAGHPGGARGSTPTTWRWTGRRTSARSTTPTARRA